MNQIISFIQKIRLRQIVTTALVVLTFIVSTAFDKYGNELQAKAESVTPEAKSYQVDRTDSQIKIDAENAKQKTQEAAQNLAETTKQTAKDAKNNTQAAGKNFFDNVREKLNLDEPIDPGTKQAVKQLEEKASEIINP